MTGIIVEIMVEVLVILAIATKEIKQRRSSESINSCYIILDSLVLRSVCEEVTGKEQDRGLPEKARYTNSGGSSDGDRGSLESHAKGGQQSDGPDRALWR